MKSLQHIHPIFFLLVATFLEVCGDAIVRIAVYNHTGLVRIGLFLAGGLLLFGYGLSLNLAPVEFGKVVGLYIATLFVMWQVNSFIIFKQVPTLPVLIGGSLIVAGGLIVTFWKE